jgi:hypothetical protein
MTTSLMVDQLSQIISQATAPAFLLGAVAGFVSVLIGRLNRIVDRGSSILAAAKDDGYSESPQSQVELAILRLRAKLMNRAIECAVISGISTTVLVIVAFASALVGLHHAYVAAGLFAVALAFFAASLTQLWLEIRVAIKQLNATFV